jgi:hypothetical protein
MRKKGQGVENLSSSAVAVLALIIIVAIGATVLQSVQTTQKAYATDLNVTDTANPYTVNTTLGQVSLATLSTKYTGLHPSVTALTAFNATSGAQLAGTLFTANITNPAALSFSWTSALNNMTATNFSYTVTYDKLNYDYNVTTQGLSALVNYGNFFNVIVVVIVFAVIIGLFAFFTMRRGQGGSL